MKQKRRAAKSKGENKRHPMSDFETIVWPFFLRKHNNAPLFYCFRCKCSCGKYKRIRYSHVNAKMGSFVIPKYCVLLLTTPNY